MFSRWWLWLLGILRIQYQVYRRTIWWLVAWLVLGVVLAIISLLVGNLGIGDINHGMIDGNILNMASVDAGIGNFMWQRVLSIWLPLLLVFGCALLSRITALVIFPLVLMHGYWLCLTYWWTFMYYTFNAIWLLLFYGIWLLLVTAILIIGLLWASNCAGRLRDTHFHCHGIGWDLVRGTIILLLTAVVLGIFEYLIFWLILGRIVYKPV